MPKPPDCPTIHLTPDRKRLELVAPASEEAAREHVAALFARVALATDGRVLWPTVRWVEGKRSCSVLCELAPQR